MALSSLLLREERVVQAHAVITEAALIAEQVLGIDNHVRLEMFKSRAAIALAHDPSAARAHAERMIHWARAHFAVHSESALLALCQYGDILDALGQTEAAHETFLEVFENSPEGTPSIRDGARIRLGELDIKLGRLEDGRQRLETALSLLEANPELSPIYEFWLKRVKAELEALGNR